MGESPLKRKKINIPSYTKKKLDEIKSSFERNLLPESSQVEVHSKDESEMIQQLKEKLAQATKRREKKDDFVYLTYELKLSENRRIIWSVKLNLGCTDFELKYFNAIIN